MKKHHRWFIAGMVFAVILSSIISTAFAAYTRQATLNYSGISITLDGKKITPKDANGNAVEPFIIDGTTYLPVRAVANALGLNVTWDGKTQTVGLYTEDAPQTTYTPIETKNVGDIIKLSGTGNLSITDVACADHASLRFTHSGNGQFTVYATGTDGYKRTLIDTIGKYDQIVYLGYKDAYQLDIIANGKWDAEGGNLSITDKTSFSGTGDFVTPYFMAPGSMWKATHDGKSNFTIWQYYNDLYQTCVDAKGEYNKTFYSYFGKGSKTFFEIIADGNWTITPVTVTTSTTYVGNKNSKVFHKSSCVSVSNMLDKNKISLSSSSAAIAAGYEPCDICRP